MELEEEIIEWQTTFGASLLKNGVALEKRRRLRLIETHKHLEPFCLEHPQQPLQIFLFKITKSILLVILTAHLFIAHFSVSLL
jgi:hypothetical protein